jgi:serine phosphatase RsbU (regulator of sigma subunit)
MLEILIAIEKIKKYATSESGDTAEIIERPHGGISVVLADGQSSGKGAKRISNMVARKVISLLAEGVRDGAAARAASDFLYAERGGKVSATLNVLSIDMGTKSLVATRNNPAPSLILLAGERQTLDDECSPIGLYRNTRPLIFEAALSDTLTACIYTDGMVHAGLRSGQPLNVPELFFSLANNPDHSPATIADCLLTSAIQADHGRPADDISVVVLKVTATQNDDGVRRMNVRLPLAD